MSAGKAQRIRAQGRHAPSAITKQVTKSRASDALFARSARAVLLAGAVAALMLVVVEVQVVY
jgi:hypothetical protein